ncbi:glycerate kinase [Tsukamurella sp. 1534]|uniref:glycerate kinase n=1 Tax=Tsukamurella sp. 1534 TaxID=1151061 RepID=UPI000317F0CC|nr:glycerate kinase [Tsukamurella sp. 1534]
MPVTVPHRILVAPSGFKESLSAAQVAEAMARGVRRVLPGAVIEAVPMVDGGEGTARALAEATDGRLVPAIVTGPVGEPVASHFALLGGDAAGTAVVEMAAAAGLRLVPADLRDPTRTTSHGVGELIRGALDAGARRIIVGCGDSGVSDGGAGMLTALGARVLGPDGAPIAPGGAGLADAARLDLACLDPRLAEAEIVVACNVHNVLCGPKGVARVFGPQKGATPQQVELLSSALERWADVLENACAAPGLDVRNGPGTGASGGIGAALAAVCGAALTSRFEVLMDGELSGVDLDAHIRRADLVLTAEGAVDYQTPHGKIPAEVARRAKRHGKPVIALAGSIGEGAADVHDIGIDAVMGIIPIPMDIAQAVSEAAPLVANATERTLRLVTLGCSFGATG